MHTEVLPLAVTMMAGPQILSAIVFVTGSQPIRKSLAFVAAIVVAASVGILAATALAGLVGDGVELGDSSGPSTVGRVVQLVLVGALIARAVYIYVNRESVKPPKWLGTLQEASVARAFLVGVLLIFLMPGDLIVMLTTGFNLAANDLSFGSAVPLIVATGLIAALPMIGYVTFRRRAEVVMPKVRNWIETHSWAVNIAVLAVFVGLVFG